VYDWGEDDGEPYLVTEYLAGGSLRAMLDAGHRLSPSQTLLVGLEAARALDYAHKRGFVHRDVKPANILFGDEGRLRIADFGLARALAEAAWTEPAGAVLGTARYAAPEQARGETVDGRADVYALALVLVEAVTGTVPFASDTTIGTLMARVDRPIEVPPELGPLGRVVARAGVPDPAERPDAGQLAVSLMAAAEELNRPDPLPLVGAAATVDDLTVVDRDPTTLPPAAADVTRTEAVYDHAAEGRAQVQVSGERSARPRFRWLRRKWLRVVAIAVAVALIAGGAAYAYMELSVPSHDVPELIGLSESAARELVADFDFDIEVRETRIDGSDPGKIVEQDPAPNASLKEGDDLVLTVSLGNTLVPVPPDLVGTTLAEATALLQEAELVVADPPTREFNEEIAKDVVLRLGDGTPEQLPKGDAVTLVVSDGPTPRTVPEIAAGASLEEATAALQGAQLVGSPSQVFHDEIPAGRVVRTDPPAGTEVPRDSAVKVFVSKGPELIAIPDVSGASVADAAATLQNAGFAVEGVAGNPGRPVLGTDPPAGEMHRRGTSVIIFTRR
jgi:eukaryotic-like serine/threonine-protein kinase